MNRKNLLIAGTVLVFSALLLAGCSQQATAPTPSPSPSASVSQQPSATPVPTATKQQATTYPGGAIEEAIEKALA